MKYIQINQQYRKTVAAVFGLAVMMLLAVSGNSLAQDFVSIKVYPEHVGVFTTVGTQQFVAFGIAANGNTTNITKNVSWKSSDTGIVTIDENGLATVADGKTSGQVMITCSYPKTGGLPLASVNLLLSGSTFTVTADAAGTGDGAVASDVGGIALTYTSPGPAAGTAESTPFTSGNAITLTATAAATHAASWDDCDAAGGTAAGNGEDAATCMFTTLLNDKTVTATFTDVQYTVTANANGTGTGTVTSNVGGISYSYLPVDTQDTTPLNPGSSITLTATGDVTDTVSWNGTCDALDGGSEAGNGTTSATCTLGSLNSDETVTVTFTDVP